MDLLQQEKNGIRKLTEIKMEIMAQLRKSEFSVQLPFSQEKKKVEQPRTDNQGVAMYWAATPQCG